MDKSLDAEIKKLEAMMADLMARQGRALSSRDEGKKNALLAKPVVFRGQRMTKARMVEKMVETGYVLELRSEPKYRFDRSKYNRLEGGAQQEYENKLRQRKEQWVAHGSDGIFFDLTQTEAEYFVSLGGKTKSPHVSVF